MTADWLAFPSLATGNTSIETTQMEQGSAVLSWLQEEEDHW
jgi:hypothetical protein